MFKFKIHLKLYTCNFDKNVSLHSIRKHKFFLILNYIISRMVPCRIAFLISKLEICNIHCNKNPLRQTIYLRIPTEQTLLINDLKQLSSALSNITTPILLMKINISSLLHAAISITLAAYGYIKFP